MYHVSNSKTNMCKLELHKLMKYLFASQNRKCIMFVSISKLEYEHNTRHFKINI